MRKNDSELVVTGFAELLALVFVILKLTRVISWSWWWVISPIWLPVVAVFGISILVLILTGITVLIKLLLEKLES